jgi:hypothetical protein
MNDDYEHVSFNAPMARAFARSFDNDTTLADEESIKPVEYYRR